MGGENEGRGVQRGVCPIADRKHKQKDSQTNTRRQQHRGERRRQQRPRQRKGQERHPHHISPLVAGQDSSPHGVLDMGDSPVKVLFRCNCKKSRCLKLYVFCSIVLPFFSCCDVCSLLSVYCRLLAFSDTT